jgi:hypothetical protein
MRRSEIRNHLINKELMQRNKLYWVLNYLLLIKISDQCIVAIKSQTTQTQIEDPSMEEWVLLVIKMPKVNITIINYSKEESKRRFHHEVK